MTARLAVGDDRPYLLDISRLIWRRWTGRAPTGIDRVCLAYLRHYGPRSQAVIQRDPMRRILSPAASDRLFAMLLDPPPRLRPRLALAIAAGLAGASRDEGAGRFYLNVGHTGLDQPGLTRWIRDADVRPIYMVHDLIPITHPHYCRPPEQARHRARMHTVLETAAGVIGNSQSTVDCLATFARDEGLPMPPALAAWLGSDVARAAGDEREDAQPATFVVVSTIEARKNHAMLLDIWQRLEVRLGEQAPRLVVIGQRGWEADAVLDRLDRLDPRGAVTYAGAFRDAGLAAHLRAARALLFPSKAEGFGLPLVEALAAGTPVIASDLPVFREIGQGVPDLVDPADEAAWEKLILDYAQPGSTRLGAQRARLAGFRLFGWDDHFAAVDRWLAALGRGA